MTRWIDALNPTDRAALNDAGRLGSDRFDGPDHLFHDDCGYRWDRHDNSIPGRKLPFGCPTEELILWYGEGNR